MTENNPQGASLASGVGEEAQALSSRRKFLTGSAALLAGGALAAALPGTAQAHKTGNPPTDVDVLNYALTLEHLEYAFYRDGLKKFDESDFQVYFARNREYERQGIRDLDGEAVRRKFVVIREHEETHVDTLKSVIKSLGG